MVEVKELGPDMTMDEIMNRWPETIAVVLRHKLLCVGCPIAGFHTPSDAALAHELSLEPFYNDLLAEIAAAKR